MNNELTHFGIKGQKWGVRRYQNKDGSLTAEGKEHVKNYKKSVSLKKREIAEGDVVVKSSKRLSRDFGQTYRMVDDEEFFNRVAREYKVDIKSLVKAQTDYKTFCRENRDSIEIGRKIVKKQRINSALKTNKRNGFDIVFGSKK